MMVCCSVASNWTRKWREFCEPVTMRGNAKLKQAGNWYASENLWLRKYDCHL